jgi:hypothetical protein
VLIDQRCRLLIIISKCVSTHGVCGCRPTLPSALAYTRTHTLSLSLSLRVTVFFPFHIKTYLPQLSSVIEIQDSIVFGCSHFIKVALIRNYFNLFLTVLELKYDILYPMVPQTDGRVQFWEWSYNFSLFVAVLTAKSIIIIWLARFKSCLLLKSYLQRAQMLQVN